MDRDDAATMSWHGVLAAATADLQEIDVHAEVVQEGRSYARLEISGAPAAEVEAFIGWRIGSAFAVQASPAGDVLVYSPAAAAPRRPTTSGRSYPKLESGPSILERIRDQVNALTREQVEAQLAKIRRNEHEQAERRQRTREASARRRREKREQGESGWKPGQPWLLRMILEKRGEATKAKQGGSTTLTVAGHSPAKLK